MEELTECLTIARFELVAARKLLHRELVAYPTPISGCDAQYSYLIGLRQQIQSALHALDKPVFVATPRTLSKGAGIEIR